jgi:NADH-quinone oxidoreductase subunit G
VLRVLPRENEAINKIWLSDRDRFSYEGVYSDDRLQAPLIKDGPKENGAWREVDWQTALEYTAKRLGQLIQIHGASRLGALVAPNATLEEMYLVQKLMRALGSPHIDHRMRQGDFSDQDRAPVFPWLGQSLVDLEMLDAALLVGSNVRKEQPLVAYRLRQAALRGARILFVNPVDYVQHFPVAAKVTASPTGMLRALAGIARALLDISGKEGPEGLAARVSGVQPDDAQKAIAEHLHGAGKATVLLGNLALAHPELATLRAIAAAIAELSGARLGYLAESANSAGGWLAGALPHRGPGGGPATNLGLDARAMLETRLKGYLLLGLEPELDGWDSAAAMSALHGAELVVSLTSYRTPTMEAYADVLLPIAAFVETSGTFVNAEGRWQSFGGGVVPMGESRPAWKILRVLGNLLNLQGFDYNASEEVREELRGFCAGVAPDNAVSICLPMSLSGEREALVRIADVPPYATDPLVRRAKSLQQTPDAVEAAAHMSVTLAERLGLLGRASVTVAQGENALTLPLVLDARIPENCILVPAGVKGSAGLGPAFGPVSIEGVGVVQRPVAQPEEVPVAEIESADASAAEKPTAGKDA